MTAIPMGSTTGERSELNRQLRRFSRRALVTLFAAVICGIFILPLIYMVSASFTDPGTSSIPSAPPWPAVPRQVTYTIPGTAQVKTLDIYIVPINGHNEELALLTKRLPPAESVFVDPKNTTRQINYAGNPYDLSRVWDFHVTMDNFSMAWDKMGVTGGFITLFRNTFLIALLGTIGAVLSAIAVAYGFSRFRIPGKNGLFLVLIGTIMLPFQVTLIPTFIVFQAIGWTGTWYPLIVPHFFANAYNVFLLRQYFLTLPRELDEAAMMDGASPWRILISVIIPQSWPAIIAVTLFHFFFAWNDFLNPLIFLSGRPELWPIAVGLNQFNTTFRNAGTPAVIQAGALMAIILPVVIFFLAQRVFMRGVVISGVEK